MSSLKNAGHLGRIGEWAERAAEANLVSIHMVNVRGSLLVAPFGGIDRRGSTSPFCAGVPMGTEEPIVLDFATSQVAEGKALVALRGGEVLVETEKRAMTERRASGLPLSQQSWSDILATTTPVGMEPAAVSGILGE